MSPERVFQSLTAIGLIAGGWLYGDYWKKSGSFEGGVRKPPNSGPKTPNFP